MKDRHDYQVLVAQLRHPSMKIVIKLAGPEATFSCPFDRAAYLYRLVSERTEIRMPQIYAVDVSYQSWPWRYIIKEHLLGEEWAGVRQNSPEPFTDIYAEIGRAVAQLHQIHFPSFGEVLPGGQIENGKPLLEALQKRSFDFIQDPEYLDFFLKVVDRFSSLFDGVRQAGLCHEDLHGYNILVKREKSAWRLATILDFDKAWAGHVESDLARMEIWRGMTSPAFWESYMATHSISPGYQERRFIYQLLWCLEFAEPSAVHNADTQKVCEALGTQLPKPFSTIRS